MSEMQYPKPSFHLAIINTGSLNQQNIDEAWAEGELPNGRPYLLELWTQGEDHLATYYMSTHHIEDENAAGLAQMLLDANLIKLNDMPIPCDAGKVKDSDGNEVWSINFVLSDGKEEYVELLHPVKYYTDLNY